MIVPVTTSPVWGWTQTYQDASSMVNQQPATGDAAIILWKRAANENGWVTNRSGDGTTFSNSGDVIGTSSAALAHSNAHFNLVSPDGSRQILVQRGASSVSWKIACVGAGGLNADCNATTWATAVGTNGDAIRALMGNSATPAFNTNYMTTDNTYYWNVAIQTVAPYGMYFFSCQKNPGSVGVIAQQNGLVVDPIWFGGDPNDLDPCVYYCWSGAASSFVLTTSGGLLTNDRDGSTGGPRGWIGKNATNGDWCGIPYQTWTGSPGKWGASLYNGADILLPILWGRDSSITTPQTSPYGVKGFSSVFRAPSQLRGNGELAGWTSVGSNDGIVMGNGSVILPWPSKATILAGP